MIIYVKKEMSNYKIGYIICKTVIILSKDF